jgi:8-oxo-dGTP diphosphatase
LEGGIAAQTDGVDALNPEHGPPAEADVIEGLTGARIRAAGGVVGRDGPGGAEVLLVHRPRFDDWSLPKGKLKRGEHPLAGAVREVREETGIRGLPGARLPTVQYDVWAGDALAEKSVDYWAMTVDPGNGLAFTAGDEVDDLAWLPVDAAMTQLSYPHDRRVLRAYAELAPLRRPVVLLRHASAGGRAQWSGPDDERPLDDAGWRQARAIAKLLALFGPGRLVSAEPLRCQQTLAPLAEKLGRQVEIDAHFNETAGPAEAAEALRGLADWAVSVVVCSQGRLIPHVVSALRGGSPLRYHVAKGDGWVLSFADTQLSALDAFGLSH